MKRQRILRVIWIAAWLPSATWADGELELSFAPRLFKTGWVKAIALQADGKILVGGLFKTINGGRRHA